MVKHLNRMIMMMLWLGSQHVAAGLWHVGLEAQQVNLTFTPGYINTLDATGYGFTGHAGGQGIAAAADYETQLYQSLWLSFQGSVSYDNAIWSARTGIDSLNNADIAWRYGFSLLPEFRLNKKYTLFTEFGIEEGLSKLDRDSEILGTFQNEQWLTGGTIGAGVRYDVDDRWGLFLSYRFTQFQHYQFYVQDEDNSISQVVQDRPYSSITSLGFTVVI
jgi:opacity protein-like surface antigen